MMKTLSLGLRMLRRDWRAGELRVLIAALVLAVGSVGTVGFFADRVKGALTRQANLLLGADLMISGDRPLPESFEARAARRVDDDARHPLQQHGADGRRRRGREHVGGAHRRQGRR
jgi:predicted lysophospholipase L1 biosynthesis ABC-type transport system permease subunit